jgi:hypothetical protein
MLCNVMQCWCIIVHSVQRYATLCKVMQSSLKVSAAKDAPNRGWFGLEVDMGVVLGVV